MPTRCLHREHKDPSTQASTQPNTQSIHMQDTHQMYTLPIHTQSIPAQSSQPNTQTTCMPHAYNTHTHSPYSDSVLTCCSKTALLLFKIIVVIRSSHKRRVTDGDKLAGKKTAIHRYLKKRHANTSNLRKANHLIWVVYKKKKRNI